MAADKRKSKPGLSEVEMAIEENNQKLLQEVEEVEREQGRKDQEENDRRLAELRE